MIAMMTTTPTWQVRWRCCQYLASCRLAYLLSRLTTCVFCPYSRSFSWRFGVGSEVWKPECTGVRVSKVSSLVWRSLERSWQQHCA